jgi:hypothetical protein
LLLPSLGQNTPTPKRKKKKSKEPDAGQPSNADAAEEGWENMGFDQWNSLFEELGALWRLAWNCGTIIVVDESMVAWEGATSAHLTLMPRKPTPLGFCFKTACDASSNVMVNMEAVEGAEIDRKKKYVE